MTFLCRVLLFSALAMNGTSASAQSPRSNHYEMVTAPQYGDNLALAAAPRHQKARTCDVIILDKRTGALWSLNGLMPEYLGTIYPVEVGGTFARIIHVNPQDR